MKALARYAAVGAMTAVTLIIATACGADVPDEKPVPDRSHAGPEQRLR